ncbi:hypothetical protein [Amorphus orientalis]|uniref:VRR-NUC domain-containing protein n=1 Tax=Amorphus orientalis TaxID=649198 RepID=A0AAE3VUD6_9HYPH|nr:hypothetical protein [Amorphus orientalis]MDQ0317781.1 hypothetical protein [Amorphus orientalis]
MLESYIERAVCRHAQSTGWIVRKLQWAGRISGPDRFFAKAGRVVLIEFKQTGKRPNKAQAREIHRLKSHGVEVHAVDTIEDGIRILGGKHPARSDADII